MPLRRRTTALITGRVMSFRRTAPLLAAGFMIFAPGVVPTAWAQDATVYIGGNPSPRGSVEVDLSVLDDFGGAGTTARGPGNQRLTLVPPGSATAKKPQPPRKTAQKPSTPKATPKAVAPKPGAASKPPVAVASKAPAAAPSAPRSTVADAPPPPPEPIDAAAAMPPPLPVSKPAPAPARISEQSGSGAPRDLKPAPPPSPMTGAAAQPDTAPAARRPDPTAQTPAIAASAATPTVTTVAATPMTTVAVTPMTASAATPAEAASPQRAPEPPRPQPAAAAPSTPPQTAALPPAQAGSSRTRRIPFTGEAIALTDAAKGEIKQIAASMSKDQALRVQVMAYASGGDDAGKARRLSLSRALAVRSYLIEQGIGSTRIDVRALGNATEGGPADRVDLVTVNR